MDRENRLIELSGTVDSVIYKNEENGYTVLRMTDENGQSVTAVGCFPYAAAGESMILSGDWMTHSVHGRQFKAEFAQRMMPSGAKAIYSYLAGGAVKGIGPATASMIVDRFGDKALEVLESSPQELAQLRGISAAKAEQISRDFRRQTGLRRLMEFICSFGLRPILAMRLYKFYGDTALNMVRDNPYIISAEHIGGSFAEADALALEMGMDGFSMNRIKAALLFELRHNTGNGHCFIPREKLSAATAQLIGVSEEDADRGIEELIDSAQLKFDVISGTNACYLPELYEAETDCARRLSAMCRDKREEKADIAGIVSRLQQRQGIKYTDLQLRTLELALKNRVVILTGGPGTGKTTSLRAILALFNTLGYKTLLTAPTGRAAKRMAELTGEEAQTVHRMLGAKFDDDGEKVVFTKNERDRLSCDAVILDEASMVDILLMDAMMRALPPDARLIMVGDADQLPPVGPGNVFSAMIRSGVVPTVRLKEIFRQNEGSRIVRNAHMINRGEYPNLSENAGDFFRLKRLEAAGAIETVSELCTTRLPNKMHIPSEDIQVLSPTRKGELGTVSLNKHLQQALNPPKEGKREKLFGDSVFREGDRVMQIRNNYDIIWQSADGKLSGAGIYNGDIGKIIAVDLETEILKVDFDGRIASYGFDALMELEHAWAMTVHKSQGSEYRAVILALGASAQALLTRGVLYTAVTRAKELLIIVGDEQTAYRMIDNFRQSRRYSALRVRLMELCGV